MMRDKEMRKKKDSYDVKNDFLTVHEQYMRRLCSAFLDRINDAVIFNLFDNMDILYLILKTRNKEKHVKNRIKK